MYFEVQILNICNNHEYDVGMNCSVKFVEIEGRNSEHRHGKCKYVAGFEISNLLNRVSKVGLA